MGRKSKPYVVEVYHKIDNAWYNRGYFDNQEMAEKFAIDKSKNNNNKYRVKKNSK
jgi:hypothetical protein